MSNLNNVNISAAPKNFYISEEPKEQKESLESLPPEILEKILREPTLKSTLFNVALTNKHLGKAVLDLKAHLCRRVRRDLGSQYSVAMKLAALVDENLDLASGAPNAKIDLKNDDEIIKNGPYVLEDNLRGGILDFLEVACNVPFSQRETFLRNLGSKVVFSPEEEEAFETIVSEALITENVVLSVRPGDSLVFEEKRVGNQEGADESFIDPSPEFKDMTTGPWIVTRGKMPKGYYDFKGPFFLMQPDIYPVDEWDLPHAKEMCGVHLSRVVGLKENARLHLPFPHDDHRVKKVMARFKGGFNMSLEDCVQSQMKNSFEYWQDPRHFIPAAVEALSRLQV